MGVEPTRDVYNRGQRFGSRDGMKKAYERAALKFSPKEEPSPLSPGRKARPA